MKLLGLRSRNFHVDVYFRFSQILFITRLDELGHMTKRSNWKINRLREARGHNNNCAMVL